MSRGLSSLHLVEIPRVRLAFQAHVHRSVGSVGLVEDGQIQRDVQSGLTEAQTAGGGIEEDRASGLAAQIVTPPRDALQGAAQADDRDLPPPVAAGAFVDVVKIKRPTLIA